MEVAFAVHVGECLQGLICDVSDLYVGKLAFLLLKLVDVAIEVLEYEVELAIFFDEFE